MDCRDSSPRLTARFAAKRGGSSQTTSAPISAPGMPGRRIRCRFQLWSERSASAAGSSGSSRAATEASVSPGSGWIQRRVRLGVTTARSVADRSQRSPARAVC